MCSRRNLPKSRRKVKDPAGLSMARQAIRTAGAALCWSVGEIGHIAATFATNHRHTCGAAATRARPGRRRSGRLAGRPCHGGAGAARGDRAAVAAGPGHGRGVGLRGGDHGCHPAALFRLHFHSTLLLRRTLLSLAPMPTLCPRNAARFGADRDNFRESGRRGMRWPYPLAAPRDQANKGCGGQGAAECGRGGTRAAPIRPDSGRPAGGRGPSGKGGGTGYSRMAEIRRP